MGPTFGLCFPVGIGVAVELPRTELEELEEPGTWPGRTSGVSIKARRV